MVLRPDASHMFQNYDKTTTLDVSNIDTLNVTNMLNMFCNATITNMVGLDKFDTSKVISMSDMFNNCKATIGYARTQKDANKFNASGNKPSTLTFKVK